MTETVHWSMLDSKTNRAGVDAGHELLTLLRARKISRRVPGGERRMTFVRLAGFWNGHKAPDEGKSLVIGRLALTYQENGGTQHVRVSETNSTSGLETKMAFQTDETGRMTGPFSLEAENASPDLFRGCRITGTAGPSGLRASFHDEEHTVALRMPAAGAPYFFTEVYKTVPLLQRRNDIAVTYDLTKVYRECCCGRMENTLLTLDDWRLPLQGWYFAGRGIPTEFLWFDEAGLLTMIGSTLSTYVLQEAIV